MSMMLILFFVACFWFIWTPKQEYRHIGTDLYYSYYIGGEPIKGWNVYKCGKDSDINNKSHRRTITKERWDSISVIQRPSVYDLRVQRILSNFTLDHQARLDSLKQESKRCSDEERKSFYVFYCKQKVGDEYIVKDSIEVLILKY